MSQTSFPRGSRLGLVSGFCAYFCWGLFPLYWRQLNHLGALEILAHRISWSLVFLAGVLTVKRQWAWLASSSRNRRTVTIFAFSAALLSFNWFLYIWAVNNGRVLESSLGYFINPLVSVLLGRVVLQERLRRVQTLAIALAVCGVAWLTWLAGTPPWISLSLAVSFGLYGLLRKIAPLGSLEGLTLETLLMAPPAIVYLSWLEVATAGHGHFAHDGPVTTMMLVFAGVLTAIPLLLFALAARRLPLSVMGVLQFVSPTMQFAIGVAVFHEAFDAHKLIGFALIWAALIVFALEGAWASQRAQPLSAAPPE